MGLSENKLALNPLANQHVSFGVSFPDSHERPQTETI